jgi:hypothetical protein
MNWYNIDDAFYYYKVAQNTLTGHGMTFDGINPTNGFHPLWMIICLGVFWLSKFNLILPLRVLVVISGLFNAAAVLVLYRLLKKFIHPYAAVIGAMIWGLLPAIYGVTIVHGMESVVSAFFIVLLLYLASEFLSQDSLVHPDPKRIAVLGLVGALTVLSRLDNVFIVAFVGLFALFKIKKISSALIYDWVALVLAVVLSWILRLGVSNVEQNMYSIYPMIGIAIVIFPVVYYFLGMYEGFSQKSNLSKIITQAAAGVVNFALMYAISYALYSLGIMHMFSHSVIFFFTVISFLFVLCLRLIQRKDNREITQSPYQKFLAWLKASWSNLLIDGGAFAAPIAFIVGIYCILNKLEFGTFTPVSGQIKSWWSTLPNTVYGHANTIVTILGLSPTAAYGPWSIVTSRIKNITTSLLHLMHASSSLSSILFVIFTIVFIFFIMVILKAQESRLGLLFFKLSGPALFVGCFFQIAYYTTVGYANTRVWYWVGENLVVILLAGVILDGIFVWIEKLKFNPKWITAALTILCTASLIFIHIRYITSMVPMKVAPGKETAYLSDVREIESFTKPGSIIGMTGGGLIAYFIQDRTIVNLDGLINSAAYFHAMKTGTATQFLDAIPLDYVYGNEYVVSESDPYNEILKNRLVEIGMIRGQDNFTLYHYVINQ